MILHDPINNRYTISAPKRKSRPFQESAECPFCPGSDEVPQVFDGIRSLPNKFSALQPDSRGGGDRSDPQGVCEVVLYSSDHDVPLYTKSPELVKELILHWKERDRLIRERYGFVKYIFPFENYGKDIGVSMEHPHGQLYALPFVPPVIRTKQTRLKGENSCIYCAGARGFIIVRRYDTVVVMVPKFAQWPIQAHIVPKAHIPGLGELEQDVIRDLANAIKSVLTAISNKYQKTIPYIMSVFQSPVGDDDFHFHIEVLSPQIDEKKIKYRAGLETALDVFINSTEMQEFAVFLEGKLR